ncbi:MAG: hypothetical protein NT069_22485 [Planctomycetota bacterium]|nr:hypothetical protein [Planctomycetota bacterium]
MAMRNTQRWRGVIAGFGILAICLSLAGCPSQPTGGNKPAEREAGSSGNDDTNPCDELLKSLFDVYRIEKFETTFDLGICANRMNDWYRGCGSAPGGNKEPALPEGAKKLFSGAQLALMSGEQFRTRDASHVRDCVLFQAIARRVSQSPLRIGETDLDRALATFEHVVSAVQLQPKHSADLPFTAYEIYLLGRGTATDRAWLFVNALRAMRLDGILLTAADAEDPGLAGESVPFVVGVPIDGQIYLFDPALGIPIPAKSSKPGRIEPATLAQVVADPTVLTQLDVGDRKYPLTSEQLKSPAVMLVGDLGYYSAQSQALQQVFIGDHAVVVSDVRLWKYPQDQIAKSLALNETQQQIRKGLKLRFMAYLVVVPDPRNPGQFTLAGSKTTRDPALQGMDEKDRDVGGFSRTETRSTSGRQMEGRLSHIAGELPTAIKAYVEVQSNAPTILRFPQDPLMIDMGSGPIDIKLFHFLAIDDAVFWSAMCQLEQGQYGPAASTFDRYLRQAAKLSEWTRQARRMRAVALAAQDKFEEAAATLEKVSEDDPEYAGYQAMVRNWKQ